MNENIVAIINTIVDYATDYLMPVMIGVFIIAVVVRLLIYVVIRQQRTFVKEFCKRVDLDISNHPDITGGFYNLVKHYLAKTYFENFEIRAKYRRRNSDHVMTIGDRVFLVQDGIIRLIDDFLKHARYLHKENREQPNFQEISNNVFSANPVFNRLFGLFSINRSNETLNILPAIFIVAGILGTFLGIMKALPELAGMNIADAAASKAVIDSFLVKISFALSTSILGIVLSILMSFLNTLLSPESIYLEIINSFKSATEILWNKCENNKVDKPGAWLNEQEHEAEDAFELAIANMYAGRH